MQNVPNRKKNSAIQVFYTTSERQHRLDQLHDELTSAMSEYCVAFTSQICRSISPSFEETTAMTVKAIESNHDGIRKAYLHGQLLTRSNYGHFYQEYGRRQDPNHLRVYTEVPIARSQEKKSHFAAQSHTEAARLCARDRYNSGWARKQPQRVVEAVCCRALLPMLITSTIALSDRIDKSVKQCNEFKNRACIECGHADEPLRSCAGHMFSSCAVGQNDCCALSHDAGRACELRWDAVLRRSFLFKITADEQERIGHSANSKYDLDCQPVPNLS